MKKFGFGKKSDDRNGGVENPYAKQQPADDPYANDKYANMSPYQQARAGLPSGPRGGGGVGLPSGPGARKGPGPAASSAPSNGANGYGNDKYGQSNGYGSDRYGQSNNTGANRFDNHNAFVANQKYDVGPEFSARGPSGYGGLGRMDSTSTDDQRDALFSGAKDRAAAAPGKDRYAQNGSAGYGATNGFNGSGGSGRYADDSNRDALLSGAQDRSSQQQQYGRSGAQGGNNAYGGYGEQRELTEEEREEQDISNVKQDIRRVKQESVASTQRSLAIAYQTEELARASLARLGAQGERLHNTERNLDLAASANKTAEEKAKELKVLNRSLFAPNLSNPFTSKQRAQEREKKVMDRHRSERDEREATRQEAFASQQRMEDGFKSLSVSGRPQYSKPSAAEKSKYSFEADEEEEAMDNEIDDNVEKISTVVHSINLIAKMQGREVDSQNGLIDRIGQKSDAVDDGVRMNRDRLNRIK